MSHYRHVTLSIAFLLALLIGMGCGPPEDPPAAEPHTLEVTRTPFSYALAAEGAATPTVAQHAPDTAQSALYYVTADGVQYLTEPVEYNQQGGQLDAVYQTTDGRAASVQIARQANGSWQVAVAFDPSDGITRVGEVLAARPGEHFHGLTERARGNNDEVPRDPSVPVALDRRGERVVMDLNGTISLYAPFYLSSRGYGLYVESTWLGLFDVAQSDRTRMRFVFDGPSLTYHVLPGTPKQVLRQYTERVGAPDPPPRWAFGTWRWRDEHSNPDVIYDGTPYRGPYNAQVYEDVAMMDALDIPLDVYWIDRPWAQGERGYGDLEWDPERFPNAESMIEWIRTEHDAEVLVWLAPWVMGDLADEALRNGYFLPSEGMVAMGVTRARPEQMEAPAFWHDLKPRMLARVDSLSWTDLRNGAQVHLGTNEDPSEAVRAQLRRAIEAAETPAELRRFLAIDDRSYVLIDYTNPEAVAWWQDHIARLLEDGVAAFKLDRAEEVVADARDAYAYDGRSMAEVQNEYPTLYARAVAEVAQKYHDEYVVMPRAGYPGAQQYANAFWAGDTRATWIGFRNTLIGGLRAAVMGYPFWGSDTGGFWGGRTTHELLARWLGLSAFSPIMEIGPINNRAPWDMPDGTGYNAEAIATWRMYALLHAHLEAYIIRYAREAETTGHPIMRPLFVEYPDDERAWTVWDEYLFGEDYLVAPVIEEGVTTREVYLPEGEWVDYWNPDADPIAGPTTVTVDVPLYKTPIFLRAGSDEAVLDLQAIYEESLEIARDQPTLPDGHQLTAK